jgi:hypothetical protein
VALPARGSSRQRIAFTSLLDQQIVGGAGHGEFVQAGVLPDGPLFEADLEDDASFTYR